MEWREAHAGALIGERYRLIAPLARGGFGAVYEAEQITTERRVAIKLLVRQPEDVSVDRMLGEARIASRLRSEHIVQVLDAGIDVQSSTVFVAMELLAGVTLLDLVEQRGPRSPHETADYVRQIASGLDKAHRHVDRDGKPSPIVHRDLKPANVFVTSRDDGSALLKILDFGTAKMLSANAPSSRIVRGTPQYMAPEQLAGDPPTPATDIWALGLVAFFLLTGRSYWVAVAKQAAPEALFGEIYALPLAAASERARALGANVTFGPAFDAWFARAVNRSPEARFQSAAEAARELVQALGGPTSAAPFTPPSYDETRTTTPPHSEEREVVPAAGSQANVSTASAPPPERRFRAGPLAAWFALLALAGGAGALLLDRTSSDHSDVDAPTPNAVEAAPVPTTPVDPHSESAPLPTTSTSPSADPEITSSAPQPADVAAPKTQRRRPVKTAATPAAAPPAQPTSPPKTAPKSKPNVYEIR